MAKQIKAIKCPHCGSVEKTKLDKDLYHCENCNTDYFLDNDDVNININNTTSVNHHSNFSMLGKNKILIIITSVVTALIIMMVIFSNLFSRPAPRTYGTYSSGSTITAKPTQVIPPKVDNTPKPLKYSNSSSAFYTYIASDNQPYSFEITLRGFDSKYQDLSGFYYEVRAVKTGKLIKSERLFSVENQYRVKDWDFRRFDNGTAYFVYGDDSNSIYAFNESNFNVEDVSKSLFTPYPELSSGIAVAKLASWGYEDSFYILTNNGKEYLIYPLDNLIMDWNSEDRFKKSRELDEKRRYLEQPSEKTKYCFEKFQDKLTLFKTVYYTKNIDPTLAFSCGVREVNNSDKPFKIHLSYGDGPVTEEKILAQDRLFFQPKIIYGTKDQLIITAKNNASPQSYFNLQSLDPNTGEIKWTILGNEDYDFIDFSVTNKHNTAYKQLIPYGDNGYVVQFFRQHKFLLVTDDGKVEEIVYKPELVFAPTAEKR